MSEDKIKVLEEKVKEYESILSDLLATRVKREGRIIAGPDKETGFYKAIVGEEEHIVVSKNGLYSINDKIVITDGAIVNKLPEVLLTPDKEEEVLFNYIEWDEIGGMKSQLEDIRRKVEFPVRYRKIYEEFKLPPSKGILLHGPPGCGKTLIAKAIASHVIKQKTATAKLFIYLKGGELLSKYVGEAENRIKGVFESARNTYVKLNIRPVIFIDEAEAILPPRGSRISSDVETTIVPTFLSEMDGFEGNNPFVILATNFPEKVDPAVQRPGRIDMKIYVGRPNREDSIEIFKIHLKKTKVAQSINSLAEISAGMLSESDKLKNELSGALIANIVNLATEYAILRRIQHDRSAMGVTIEDIERSVNNQ